MSRDTKDLKTEGDALRYLCEQIVQLSHDLKAGRLDAFKTRLAAIYEFASNYLDDE